MRSRFSRIVVASALLICFVCPLLEVFDRWDHTLQTGNDGEYMAVVLALCVGAMYSIARSMIGVSAPESIGQSEYDARANAHVCVLTANHRLFPGFLIPASPPALELRV